MKPTNAKGNARLFLRHIYQELSETQRSMKPTEYFNLAAKIGLSTEQTKAALRQLKDDLLIRFHPDD
jgi:hypothetical protein